MNKAKIKVANAVLGDEAKVALLDIAIEEKALFTARLIIGLRGDMTEEEADLLLHFMAIELTLAPPAK